MVRRTIRHSSQRERGRSNVRIAGGALHQFTPGATRGAPCGGGRGAVHFPGSGTQARCRRTVRRAFGACGSPVSNTRARTAHRSRFPRSVARTRSQERRHPNSLRSRPQPVAPCASARPPQIECVLVRELVEQPAEQAAACCPTRSHRGRVRANARARWFACDLLGGTARPACGAGGSQLPHARAVVVPQIECGLLSGAGRTACGAGGSLLPHARAWGSAGPSGRACGAGGTRSRAPSGAACFARSDRVPDTNPTLARGATCCRLLRRLFDPLR